LRFRDDDYATLTLYRTDIGEEPEPGAVSKESLLRMCREQGDSRATLKFLVLQTAIPGSTASIVPPTITDKDRHLPPIDTRPQDRSSKDGSLHSASGSSANERQSEWSEVGMEWSASGSGLQRAKQNTRHMERRLPSASSSSRSLNLDNGNNHNPNNRDSRTSSPRSFVNVDYPSPNAYHPPRSFTPVQATAGPSRRNGNGSAGGEAGLGLFEDDGMDPETRALIAQMQKEDEIARQQAEARQAQELADERFARNEQQQERDVWQAMQAMQLDARRQTQEQIELDAQRAVSIFTVFMG
jgi:mitogen-activated protein kinase kinase kinase